MVCYRGLSVFNRMGLHGRTAEWHAATGRAVPTTIPLQVRSPAFFHVDIVNFLEKPTANYYQLQIVVCVMSTVLEGLQMTDKNHRGGGGLDPAKP
jgi:hypothetical protein